MFANANAFKDNVKRIFFDGEPFAKFALRSQNRPYIASS